MKKNQFQTILNTLLPFTAWGIFLFVVIRYLFHPIHDGDTWWHLANGKYMFHNRTFLRNDVFSEPLLGARWVNFEWLSELVMAALVKLGGIKALFAAKVLLSATTLSLFAFSLILVGANGAPLFILFFLGFQLLQTRLCMRVELVTLNMLPLFVLLTLSIPRLSIGVKKYIPWLFGFLMVIWVNAHGGFVYGMALFIAMNIGARLSGWTKTNIAILDRSLVMLFIAVLINPFGPYLVEPFLQHLIDFDKAKGLIAEWENPSVLTAPIFWALLALGTAATIQILFKQKKSSTFWIPAFVIFGFLTSAYYRNTAMLAFVVLPFIASETPWPKLKNISWVLWLAAFLILIPSIKSLSQPWPNRVLDPESIPAKATSFVAQENISGTLYNSYGHGGYLAWTLGPDQKIFMDGRYISYPLLIENHDLMFGKKTGFSPHAWAAYFRHYNIDFAMTKYEPLRLLNNQLSPFPHESVMNHMFPKSDWALVYWDDASLVFLKRIPKYAPPIAAHEYKKIRPYDLEGMVNSLVGKKLTKEEIQIELNRHQKETGFTKRGALIQELLNRAL